MESFLKESVNMYLKLYQEATGTEKIIKPSAMPFVEESQFDSPVTKPEIPDVKLQCPSCKKIIRTGKMERKPQETPPPKVYGKCQTMALRILMKLLYAARMARFDLLRPVTLLARSVTKWDEDCDKRLDKLLSYVHATSELKLYGYVGENLEDMAIQVYCDADYAGIHSQHSTTCLLYTSPSPRD